MTSQLRQVLGAVLAVALLPALSWAQDAATISGRVTNETNAPLPAASVFLEGMNLGTVTGEGGEYQFTVPGARVQGQQVTLTARVIGYRPSSVQITLRPGPIQQNFQLSLNPLRLGEVVVTGAGTETTREKLGNVINSVSAEQITRSQEPNVVQALAGKAPNVQVQQQSGEPGASSYIRIRGGKSIQGTGQPLFVVDGVPIDNTTFATGASTGGTIAPNRASDLNPADIESVEILKGAAAAAIYGARAAQGVVLITTKSGRAGATRYSLRSSYSWDDVNLGIPLQRTYGHGTGGTRSGSWVACLEADNEDCVTTGGSFGPRLDASTPTYDHWDELFTTGHMWDNTLTASGGSDRTTFYASIGRLDHEGVIVGPNSWYEKTTARLKATHQLLDRLTIGGNFAYVDTRGSYIQKGSNVSGLLLGAMRTAPDYDSRPYIDPETGLHRSYRYPNPSAGSLTNSRVYDNPFFVINEHANESELGRVYGNLSLDYEALDWLQLAYTLGADYYADWRLEGLPFTASSWPTGLVTRLDIINLQIDHNLTATATRTFSPDFSGSLTLGNNLNSRRYRRDYGYGFDLIAPEPFSLNNTIAWQSDEFRSLIHTESYFAQATADLFDQLFLTAAVRNDGFSTFGASERRHWFPKASLAWVFTNALGNTDQRGLLSFGKARFAYGQTGREPNVYQTLTLYATAMGTGWGDVLNTTQAGLGGLRPGFAKGNPDIKPERTTEFEGGIDLGFFDQRADLSVTYYDATSKDVLLTLPLPPSTGYTSSLENAAEITNKGWEATLNIRPVTRDDLAWDVGLQWSTNDNEVTDLFGATYVTMSAGTFSGAYGTATVGFPLGVLRGRDFVRCGEGLTVGGVAIDNAAGHCQGAPDGALYIAANGFPVADPTDRVIADPTPEWLGSVRSSLTFFRRWQISGLVDIREGGDVWNGTRGALTTFGTHQDTEMRGEQRVFGQTFLQDVYPVVAGPGAGQAVTLGQTWFAGTGGGFGPVSAQFIEDGSYVKLRELAIGVTLDQPFVRNRLGMSSIDIRLAGRNLKTWTDYRGIDPETNLGGAEVYVQGIDYFNNPQTRSFILSVGLNR